MAGIFISYRRVDTLPWAGHLFADLARYFGKAQVFMDINGGIPRGSRFPDVLGSALAGCDALLVLIGPQWLTCIHDDGRRRLDCSEDWVRKEIATALGRGIPVFPVLFGGTAQPGTADLPDEIRGLCEFQSAEISDTRWNHDLGALITDLELHVEPAPAEADVALASSGILALKALMSEVPAIAQTIGRSRELLETMRRKRARLEAYKTLHDALQAIERDCLAPMEASGTGARLRPFRLPLATQTRRIEDCLATKILDLVLGDELLEELERTRQAVEAAVEQPGGESFQQAVNQLHELVSKHPPHLDTGIVHTATELGIDRLLELMLAIRASLPQDNQGGSLARFAEAIEAIARLRDQLRDQVREHTLLQRLDTKLRAACVGGGAGRLDKEWERIRQARARITPPHSATFETALEDLGAIEADLDAAAVAGEERVLLDLLKEYFRAVGTVFRDVDASLKMFCWQLGKVTEPIDVVLSLC